jgi:hypothetical protein
MNMNWLNGLGDRNPQLLRELQGRFQLRSVLATIGIVVVGQILLLIFFTGLLPNEDARYSAFCLGGFRPGCLPDWQRWGGELFKTLTYIITYALYIPGAYALVGDIGQEAQRGTLNFLRLSPRSSQNILLGKLLGVPILGYFSLLLLFPLHLIVGLFGSVPIGFFVSFYFALFAWGALLFTASMFAGFNGRAPNKVGGVSSLIIVVLIAIAGIPANLYLNSITIWREFGISGLSADRANTLAWFGLPINQDVIWSHVFLFTNLAFITYWLWRALQRAFDKPTATTISKRQGYTIATYLTVLLLGFIQRNQGGSSSLGQLGAIASLLVYASIPLIFMLSTPRQMLLDWSQRRREISAAQRSENVSPGKRRSTEITDRVFGEKSPGVTAILICGLIAYMVMSLALPFTGKYFARGLLGLALSMSLVANYTLLVQLMLLLETSKRYVWAFGSLACAIVIPGICAVIPGLSRLAGYFTPGLWSLLVNFNDRYDADFPVMTAVLALMVQLIVLAIQVFAFNDRLRRLGRSV